MKKKGNTSSNVMEQRHASNDVFDDFPTPPWATRAMLAEVLAPRVFRATGDTLDGLVAWEPACNRGYMARPLAESFARVITSDVSDYGWTGQQSQGDFTLPGQEPVEVRERGVDFICTNPPFVLAEQFALRCLDLKPRVGFALLVRLSFLDTLGRYENLWSKAPPAVVAQYAERVPMVKNRYDPKASTATAYAWLIWLTRHIGPTELTWIPPGQKKKRFRAGDVRWEQRAASTEP